MPGTTACESSARHSAAAREYVEWFGDDIETSSLLAWIYVEAGNADRARTILGKSNPARGSITRARVLKATGEADAAFEILERMFDARERGLLWFSTYPGNDVFRDDPRYEELIRRMGVAVQDPD